MNTPDYLPLQDGVDYIDGEGRKVHIAGPTKDNPDWVWAHSGFWYERATGKRLTYSLQDGSHPVDGRTRYDIVSKA